MRGKIKYRRELQKSYIIFAECEKNMIESYCGQMMLRNKIKGMAECEVRLTDGQREVWFDTSSLHTLEQAFTVKEICHADLHHLFLQIIGVINEAEKYLLDARQLCFEPEYLYVDMEKQKIKFLFDFTEEREESSIRKLAEFILERVCHEDTAAAELAYFFYDHAEKGQISVCELQNYLEKNEKNQDVSESKGRETIFIEEQNREKEAQSYEKDKKEIRVEKDSTDEKIQALYLEREMQPVAGMKKAAIWNRKCGKIIEGGLVLAVMSLLFAASLLPARIYFLFTDNEQILWLIISILLFAAGVIISIWGFVKDRKEERGTKDKNILKKEEEGRSLEKETEMWQWEIEAASYPKEKEAEAMDGRTVYVGKSLLNREYSLIERKKESEKEYPISSYPFLIGKEKERVNLVVKEHSVSRIHAKLTEENGNIFVEDLNSTNGTYLNDLPLAPHDRIKLKRGDMLQFGKAEFVFR